MKILIPEIPDEGLDLSIEEMLKADVIKIVSPVNGNLSIKKVGAEIVITGDITAEAELECSRCLKKYTDRIHASVNVMYHPVGELKGEVKHEIREDELEMGFYAGDEFDLLELLKEQIVLNIPMKPLCSETCKGICPRCGANLNINKCDCNVTGVDSRLEILRELLRRE